MGPALPSGLGDEETTLLLEGVRPPRPGKATLLPVPPEGLIVPVDEDGLLGRRLGLIMTGSSDLGGLDNACKGS